MKDFIKNTYAQVKAWPFSQLIITGLILYILFDRFMDRPKSVEKIDQALTKTKEAEDRLQDAEWLIVDLRKKQQQLTEIVDALSVSNRASLKTIDAINHKYAAENDSLRRSVELRSQRIINQLTQQK